MSEEEGVDRSEVSPLQRLVTQIIIGILLFGVLALATWGIAEIRRGMEWSGAVSPQILTAFEWVEDLLFGGDTLCLTAFVITEILRFVRHMWRELCEEA